jgi:hypothetical protein
MYTSCILGLLPFFNAINILLLIKKKKKRALILNFKNIVSSQEIALIEL